MRYLLDLSLLSWGYCITVVVTSYQTIAMYTVKNPVILRGFLRRAPQELWTSWGEWISRHGQRVFGESRWKRCGGVWGLFADTNGYCIPGFFTQVSVFFWLLLLLLLLLLLPEVMLERRGMYILHSWRCWLLQVKFCWSVLTQGEIPWLSHWAGGNRSGYLAWN